MLTADDMLKFLTGQLEDKEIEYFKHHPEELVRKLDGATVEATVLFCDIVGFTKFSENHDLQKIRILLKTTLPAIAEEIRQSGGAVDKYIGDAVMAIFGFHRARWPSTHDTANGISCQASGREDP